MDRLDRFAARLRMPPWVVALTAVFLVDSLIAVGIVSAVTASAPTAAKPKQWTEAELKAALRDKYMSEVLQLLGEPRYTFRPLRPEDTGYAPVGSGYMRIAAATEGSPPGWLYYRIPLAEPDGQVRTRDVDVFVPNGRVQIVNISK